jgi:acetyltransferase-like isoleucine patch superfamily enzyme
MPDQPNLDPEVIRIGDRSLIGRGSTVVGHTSIVIGDDVWTGHNVHITDMNHNYEDLNTPIGRQWMEPEPVVIGDGAWLGHGTVVLPGARIGRHTVVGANSVVTGELPDRCVAVGAPAKVVRQYVEGRGWVAAKDL